MKYYIMFFVCCCLSIPSYCMEKIITVPDNIYTTLCNASINAKKAFSMFEDSSSNKQQEFINDAMVLYNAVQEHKDFHITSHDLSHMALLITTRRLSANESIVLVNNTSENQLIKLVSFADYLNVNHLAFRHMLIKLINHCDKYPCLSALYRQYELFTNAQDLGVDLINRRLEVLRSNKDIFSTMPVRIKIPENIKTIDELKEFNQKAKNAVIVGIFGRKNNMLLNNSYIEEYNFLTFDINITLYVLTIINKLFEILNVNGASFNTAAIDYYNRDKTINIDELMQAMPNLQVINFGDSNFKNMYSKTSYPDVIKIFVTEDYLIHNSAIHDMLIRKYHSTNYTVQEVKDIFPNA